MKEITRYHHNPAKPSSEQWNLDIQNIFIQQYCMTCPSREKNKVACRTLTSLLAAQDSHRTHFTLDGPLKFDARKGQVICENYPAKPLS